MKSPSFVCLSIVGNTYLVTFGHPKFSHCSGFFTSEHIWTRPFTIFYPLEPRSWLAFNRLKKSRASSQRCDRSQAPMAVVNVTAFGSSSSCSICPGWDVSMGHTTNTQTKNKCWTNNQLQVNLALFFWWSQTKYLDLKWFESTLSTPWLRCGVRSSAWGQRPNDGTPAAGMKWGAIFLDACGDVSFHPRLLWWTPTSKDGFFCALFCSPSESEQNSVHTQIYIYIYTIIYIYYT